MKTCDCHCDTLRDGSGQRGRYLKALDPTYAPIDGRSLENMLVFARRYAALIRFYDIPESTVSGEAPNWVEFFRRDLAVIAASIAVVDTAGLKREYDELRNMLEVHPNRATLRALFDPILGMVRRIDGWYSIAIEQNPLHGDLALAITSSLREQVGKIRAFEEGFKYEDPTHPLDLDYSSIDSTLWGLDQPVEPDKSVYQGATPEDRIRSVALYIDDVFHVFYGFMTDLVTVKSVGYMKFALESYPAHQPHMALFIAFLELFRLVQDQMNGLTARMLDFYYRDVLHLAPKPPVPDRVHVVFELAKDVLEYDVEQDTALKAGKDAAGKDLTYRTTTDLVVNQAKVKELKNIQIAKKQKTATVSTIDAIFARPVANSGDGFGDKIADPSGKWYTFGRGLAPAGKTETLCQKIAGTDESADTRKDQAPIGFALASPQLVLQGGNRLIAWQIDDLPKLLPTDRAKRAAEIRLTGEKGWLAVGYLESVKEVVDKVAKDGVFPDSHEAGFQTDDEHLYIYLPVSADAVVPFDPALHTGAAYGTTYPVAQVVLDPLELDSAWNLRSGRQALWVRVGSIGPATTAAPTLEFDGLKTLVLQNETGLLDAGKPFDPFTLYPDFGKGFYIGSGEVFNKPLSEKLDDDLTVNIRYTHDDDDAVKIGNDVDTYTVSILRERRWIPFGLFKRGELAQDILRHNPEVPFDRQPITPVEALGMQTSKGFIRLALQRRPAGEIFVPPTLEQRQEMAADLQIKEISVSYVSHLRQFDPDIEQFFHIYPFGVTEVFPGSLDPDDTKLADRQRVFADLDAAKDALLVDAKQFLLPQFTFVGANDAFRTALTNAKQPPATGVAAGATVSRCEAFIQQLVDEANASKAGTGTGLNQYSGTEPEEGLLLIGLENLRPLDTLSLLFQFAEGSAADEDNDPPEIHWSYLTNNEWRPLKGENLVSDGTYGFQATGIVRIDVPEDITSNNTIVTTGLLWFCASVAEHSDRIPMLVSVVTQATEAQLQDNDNDSSHFDTALPAGSISSLAVAVAEIGKVSQPFASFDGKHREVGKEFYTRVSERLRHKARAITAWDYEHLVLDRFPSIYKVKCITHTDPNCLCRSSADNKTCCGPQIAPGHVLVVPISNLQNRNAVNPLQPKTGRRTLRAIEDYLAPRTSPFVHVHARNPVYEQILVFFQVQFIEGTNKGYFLKKLNDEIVHFLTPWAFDDEAEVSFAQKVYASAIINFIEERTYVDFIADFFMFVCRDECCPEPVETAPTDITLADALTHMTGCCDTEALFVAKGHNFICEVIAEPATARSILVSAPKHIIIPYEAPPEPSPCDKRRSARLGVSEGVGAVATAKRPARKSAQPAKPAAEGAKPRARAKKAG